MTLEASMGHMWLTFTQRVLTLQPILTTHGQPIYLQLNWHLSLFGYSGSSHQAQCGPEARAKILQVLYSSSTNLLHPQLLRRQSLFRH